MMAHFEKPKSVAEMTDEELCVRFDKDIWYDCHSVRARASRSDAAKEVLARIPRILPVIIRHLETHKELDKFDLRQAWGLHLYWLQQQVSPKDTRQIHLGDTAGWIAWMKERLG
jgi:mRNA-degrading endonuclease HigB of HigAB toxin-antitoxin module